MKFFFHGTKKNNKGELESILVENNLVEVLFLVKNY
ncbi:hypothetical protein D2A66_05885 [Enterococcus faecalis]|nr:hypothetical protein [Enterococcus faecalis]EGO8756921.1 hypothetical protein [Enterococcus faecalis]EGO8833144.1 hypothetical protein [Enterococcus faecalis]EGO8937909.1 hypothetical protein [Enterococcus faecalis]EGO9018315.1 hypothetical protein [Enterococcus faecalis]